MPTPTARAPAPETLRLIWRAMLGSLAVYAAVPWLMRPEPSQASASGPLLLALMGIAALLGIGSLIAREVLIVRPIRSGSLDPTSIEGSARFAQTSIALWAISESIAVFGLIGFFVAGNAESAYLFMMASAGLLFAHRPRILPRVR